MGITNADFQIEGTSAVAIERLKVAVKCPKCFMCHGAKPSGPVAVEFLEPLEPLIAFAVSSAVNGLYDRPSGMCLSNLRLTRQKTFPALGGKAYCRINLLAMALSEEKTFPSNSTG